MGSKRSFYMTSFSMMYKLSEEESTTIDKICKEEANAYASFFRWLELDLKLVVDIGIVGALNVGKNMFLSVISVDMQCCLTCNVRSLV
uniref:Uncharacterized protein n=1 Tax=Lactuca sativa TaxID=4236 RepID=A0A9R1VFI7_LACSA|nr:hypothetical protein LSAT_V11C500289010 [Lactuca sativa]